MNLRRRQSGFTLIELMVVIVLIGIGTTVGILRFKNYLPRARLDKAARDIGGFLVRLRGMAVFAGRSHYIEYDLENDRYRLGRPSTFAERDEGAEDYIESDWFDHVPHVAIEDVQFSERDVLNRGLVRVEFTPTGEVTGHLVHLVSNEILGEAGRFTVELNPVTGFVSYVPGHKEYAQVRNEFDFR